MCRRRKSCVLDFSYFPYREPLILNIYISTVSSKTSDQEGLCKLLYFAFSKKKKNFLNLQ